ASQAVLDRDAVSEGRGVGAGDVDRPLDRAGADVEGGAGELARGAGGVEAEGLLEARRLVDLRGVDVRRQRFLALVLRLTHGPGEICPVSGSAPTNHRHL